jgi:hypothetical protein
VHIRRALLLFAIVLGLAAIAASVSRTSDESPERADDAVAPPATDRGQTPTVAPGDATTGVVVLVFDTAREQTRHVEVGQPATLLMEVDEPAQVEIPDLGLSGVGDPLTPARFEVLANEPGRHQIELTPAASDEPQAGGTLVVKAPDER